MKMKKQYLSIIAGLIALLAMNACTDGFEEINTNPNRLTTTEPEFIFGLSPVSTLRTIGGAGNGAVRANNWFIFGNYSQMWSVVGGGGPAFNAEGAADDLWNNLYGNALKPLFNIVNNYDNNPGYTNRVAMAKIWRSYVFSLLVGMYGPLPYVEACNGEVETRFDKEEDVYLGILAELKAAYQALNENNTVDKYPAAAEPFLKSDLTRWSQFAHCIRLRTAMRIADCDVKNPDKPWLVNLANTAKAVVAEELENAENNLLIKDNTGNFSMAFVPGEADNTQNPLFFIVNQSTEKDQKLGDFPIIHESLMMWMKPATYDDPVLSYYITEANVGSGQTRGMDKYRGRPNSMSRPTDYNRPGWSNPYDKTNKYEHFATIGSAFQKSNAVYYFFSYPELCFLRAEAKLKGYWTGGSKTAEECYYEGIDARCLKYGITQAKINPYKNFPGIKWSTPTDTVSASVIPDEFFDYLGGFTNSLLGGEEDNLKRIIVQHWISLFGQNIDAWTLIRRTQLIPFKPNFSTSLNDGYIKLDTHGQWGYIPERLVYPGGERRINTKEAQNAIQNYLYDNTLHDVLDRVTFRLIFAADNSGLPEPPIGTAAYSAFPYALPNLAINRINK
ncbi:hypothetical protein FACS189413_04810 [Bacteroidia bacterium]|nr:hypothetical protein FACS189413_04810 [Bacteroidia bacterium]